MHIRGKSGNYYALAAAVKSFFKGFAHHALRHGIPGFLDICGIAQKRKDTFSPELSETDQIHHLFGYRSHVYFEISGLNDRTYRSFDRQSDRIRYRMIHMDKLDRKRA